jgi:hypothetical protein
VGFLSPSRRARRNFKYAIAKSFLTHNSSSLSRLILSLSNIHQFLVIRPRKGVLRKMGMSRLKPTLIFTSSLPVAYVNHSKALVATEGYYSHVFITTNIRVKGMGRQLEVSTGKFSEWENVTARRRYNRPEVAAVPRDLVPPHQ